MSDLPTLLKGLTTLEQEVVDTARCGEWAEPDNVLPVDELEAIDDPDRRVRAELLRELLMGRRGELDPRGVRIRGVRVVGALNLDYVTTVTGLTLVGCVLPDGMTGVRARLHKVDLSGSQISWAGRGGELGALQLPGAHVGGQLGLERTKVTNGYGPAINAENLRTDDHVSLRHAIVIGTSETGALRLVGADIGGQLMLDHAEVTNATGPALCANNLRTNAHLSLQNTTVSGADEYGAVRLAGAHVRGHLNLAYTNVTNAAGPALDADRLRTDDHMWLRDSTMTGTSTRGTVRLVGARVAGQLDFRGAEITNDNGLGVAASNLRTEDHLWLRDATVNGAGVDGAITLIGAHIGGNLHLDRIQVYNELGRTIGIDEAQVTGALCLHASIVCSHTYTNTGQRACPDSPRRIAVRGLVFSRLEDVSWQQWLHLLVHHTPEYTPQPYQHLAAVERAAGHDNNARQILIAQQEDLRRRAPEALGRRLAQERHRLWGWLGRYGYRAHRLVIALALLTALAGVLGYAAGQVPTRPDHHAAERVQTPTAAGSPGTPCSTAELIGLGIDRGLPLGATGLRARCDLDTSTQWGQIFTYMIWAVQALVWALATLAIAAYTGLVRKPSS